LGIRFPYRGWLLDLDGTVYLGEQLIPGAAVAIAALREAGRRVAFLSNKPLQTRDDYAAKLSRLGVPATADDVINSSLVLARHLRTKLNIALQAVRGGARLIATNPDRTCPVEGGEIPDCAGMIAAVEAVTDTKVELIVGKPSPIILEVALRALGCAASESVIVGDRVETDMVMGKRLGLATILVLSGVTHADDPRIAALAPDHVLRSVRELIV